MKKTKSFKFLLVIITAIAALFACVFTLAPKAQRVAADANSINLVVEGKSEVSTTEGEFTLTLKLTNNPGIWGVEFRFCYDSSVFEVKSVDNSQCGFQDKYNAFNAKPVGYVKIAPTQTGLTNVTTPEVIIGSITFKLKEGVEFAVTPYSFTIDEPIMLTVEGNELTCVYEPFQVTVTAPSAA